ncbi:MAG: zf-HC2 domain-containing protein [Deltaproteobacteria bacterium]|nr:zf-HC2 domain-containing protein [Deltaproteobacteria bacterium]
MVGDKDLPNGACKEFEQDLVLYHYRECTEEQRNRVATHLLSCAHCRSFLASLSDILAATVKGDEPPPEFWESYSKEMRLKLDSLGERDLWWRRIASVFYPWPVPALVGALVLLLAVTLTFTKGIWEAKDQLANGEKIAEIQPVSENIEFFKSMDFLESLDLLEEMEAAKAKPKDA